MGRANKLRRLEEFRRTKPHCSASALAQILTDIKHHGAPELTDRKSMRQARDKVATLVAPYGCILKPMNVMSKSGAMLQVPMACPFASLTYVMQDSDSFRSCFKKCLSTKPSTPEQPWSIVLYCDEVTPGNPLATLNKRRFHAFYWSFLELGTEVLSHEESWFILLTEFSTVINELEGGLSACFASTAKAFFGDGLDMHRGGITLSLDSDTDIKFFAKLGSVLLDGGAHKYVWGARGDGASKFCILCKNIWTNKSNIIAEDGSNLLRCDVLTVDGLEAATDAELRTNMRYLQQESARLTVDEFTLLQQALGLTFHPGNVLVDRDLDSVLSPTSAYSHDWMHCMFVDGVANLTVYLAFEACIDAGMPGVYESFSAYTSNWRHPSRLHATHLDDIFRADRRESHRKSHHIKCQASDLLTLMGPLSQYVKHVLEVTGIALLACSALLHLVDLTDLVAATARRDVSPDTLRDTVQRFLRAFVTAFGCEWLIPKAHWLLHLPAQLQRFGRLLNCFCLERKQRVPKRYATELKNISGGSDSLLRESICHHFSTIKHYAFNFEVSLVDKRPASKKNRKLFYELFNLDDDGTPVFVSPVARFSPVALCSRNDIVLVKDTNDAFKAARLHLTFQIHDEVLSLVRAFSLVRRDPRDSSLAVWEMVDGPNEAFETKDILASVEYVEYPNGNVATILPLEFR